jgi:hypothetical protein
MHTKLLPVHCDICHLVYAIELIKCLFVNSFLFWFSNFQDRNWCKTPVTIQCYMTTAVSSYLFFYFSTHSNHAHKVAYGTLWYLSSLCYRIYKMLICQFFSVLIFKTKYFISNLLVGTPRILAKYWAQDYKTDNGDQSLILGIWLAVMETSLHISQSKAYDYAWDLRLVSNLCFIIFGPDHCCCYKSWPDS